MTVTPTAGSGATTSSWRRPVVETDPTASRARQIAALVWLPVIVGALLLGDARPVRPVWLLVIGLVLASVGWLAVSFRIVRPTWIVPAAVLCLGTGGCLLLLGAGTWTAAAAFPFLGAHMAGVRLPLRSAVGLCVLLAAGMIASLLPYESVWDPVVIAVSVSAVLLLGVVRRDSARRAQEREQSLVADARARAEHARADAIAERARIARDVHDVLAHSLSALAVQLQGARLMAQRDGAAADTIAQIERAQRLATEGLTEARRAVRTLREGPASRTDVAEGLRELVAEHPGATADVDDVGELDPRAGETVLRVAQEALSNVRKHAPEATVRVRLHRDGDGTALEVVDVAGHAPPPPDGAGYGLVGMAERAELVDATLEAGPTDDGWRVALRVPDREGSER